jgi:hypothetical protein
METQEEIQRNGAANPAEMQADAEKQRQAAIEQITKDGQAKSGYHRIFHQSLDEVMAVADLWCCKAGWQPVGAPFMTQHMPDVSVLNPQAQVRVAVVWNQCLWKMPPGFNRLANQHKLL